MLLEPGASRGRLEWRRSIALIADFVAQLSAGDDARVAEDFLQVVLNGVVMNSRSARGIHLLNKTTIDGKTKMASDPLFNMAAQLVGA